VVQPTLSVDNVTVIGIPFLTSDLWRGFNPLPGGAHFEHRRYAEKEGFRSLTTAINLGSEPSPSTQIEIELVFTVKADRLGTR